MKNRLLLQRDDSLRDLVPGPLHTASNLREVVWFMVLEDAAYKDWTLSSMLRQRRLVEGARYCTGDTMTTPGKHWTIGTASARGLWILVLVRWGRQSGLEADPRVVLTPKDQSPRVLWPLLKACGVKPAPLARNLLSSLLLISHLCPDRTIAWWVSLLPPVMVVHGGFFQRRWGHFTTVKRCNNWQNCSGSKLPSSSQ